MNNPIIQYFIPSETIVSKANIRPANKVFDIEALANDIERNNQIQPAIIRMENGKPAVIAGQRRRKVLLELEKANDDTRMAGIVVTADDYEATAISLSENKGQSPMSPLDFNKAFARLALQGWDNANIAQVYSMTELEVKKTLAIGSLPASIIKAYESGDIDGDCLRVLAIADKTKLRKWVGLHKNGEAPTYYRHIRSFLANDKCVIATSVALFDVSEAKLAIVEDFFEDEQFFADSDEFWTLQHAEVQAIKAEYEGRGWAVELVDESYLNWEYTDLAKRKGGKVYIFIAESGRVEVKRGIVSFPELRAIEKKLIGDSTEPELQNTEKPEVTKKLNEYLLAYMTQSTHTAVLGDYELAQRVFLVMLLNNDGVLSVGNCQQLARVDGEIANGELFDSTAYKEAQSATQQAMKNCGTKTSEVYYAREFDKTFIKVMKLSLKQVQQAIQAVLVSAISLNSQATMAVFKETKPDMTQFWNAKQGRAFFDAVSSKPLLLSLLADLTE